MNVKSRRGRRATTVASCVALALLLISGCAPGYNDQMASVNHIVFGHRYDDFVWFAKDGAKNGKAQYGYMDWSTDNCSSIGDKLLNADGFKYACRRHDFSWRNLKRVEDQKDKNVWHDNNGKAANRRFDSDMNTVCKRLPWHKEPGCYAESEVAEKAVNFALDWIIWPGCPCGRTSGNFQW